MTRPDWADEPTAEYPQWEREKDDRQPMAVFEGWETTEERALLELALRRALGARRVIEGGRGRTR